MRLVLPCQIPLSEYVRAVHRKQGPPIQISELEQRSEWMRDVICLLSAVGALEPLSAIRPPAETVVSVFDKVVNVPPATDEDTPSEAKLIKICAPLHLSVVVDKLRGEPANLTAEESGEVFFKKMQIFGFSEGFCPPFEPADGDNVGTFYNIEHIILCPGSGFDLYARNHDPFSEARFRVHAEIWGAC